MGGYCHLVRPRARPAVPASPRWGSAPWLAALAVALALASALDAAGAFSGIDQGAVDHLMPALNPARTAPSGILTGLYRPYAPGTPWWQSILDLWTYPCSVLASGLLVLAAAALAARRGRPALALAAPVAWAGGNALELLGKGLLHRPLLVAHAAGATVPLTSFDTSFPSGHAIRGLVVAWALAALWPRARASLALWYAFVPVFLVMAAAHTPSDVVGGLLVGLLVSGAAGELADRLPGARPRLRPGTLRRARRSRAGATSGAG